MTFRARQDAGVVLVVALLSMTLLVALGSTVLLATMTETAIAASYREATQTLYAAEASVHYAMQELSGISDWSAIDEPLSSSCPVDLTLATEEVNASGQPEWVLFA